MKALASLALLAALGSAAFAQTALTAAGSLTATDPTFRRPDSLIAQVTAGTTDGGAAAYDAYTFTAPTSGVYVGELTSPDTLDTYLLVYSGTFNPASPLTNLINGDDDYLGAFTVIPPSNTATSLRNSRISAVAGGSNYNNGTGLVLTAGASYVAVVTSYYNPTLPGGVGSYRLGIGTGSAVPEPATMAALGLGAAALLRRKRKSA